MIALTLMLIATPVVAKHWWQDGPALPRFTGRVVDDADLLSDEQERTLSKRLAKLEATSHHQFVVVTTPSLGGQSIERFGIRLGNAWGIGRKGVDDGVLLIVAPIERKVRIEVGYGLEKQLSDPVCAQMIREAIVPRFRRSDMAGGIEAGTAAIIHTLGNKPS